MKKNTEKHGEEKNRANNNLYHYHLDFDFDKQYSCCTILLRAITILVSSFAIRTHCPRSCGNLNALKFAVSSFFACVLCECICIFNLAFILEGGNHQISLLKTIMNVSVVELNWIFIFTSSGLLHSIDY